MGDIAAIRGELVAERDAELTGVQGAVVGKSGLSTAKAWFKSCMCGVESFVRWVGLYMSCCVATKGKTHEW